MARPKKDPASLKAEILRVPVSEAEKNYIYEAATSTEGEFARWARTILLKAAEDWHASHSGTATKSPKRPREAQKEKAASAP
jgi:hypothetical protein